MKILSVSEVKATLSEQLRHVRQGEVVVITDRGRPVARIVPVESKETDAELRELERAGLVRKGTGRLPASFWKLPRPPDSDASVRAAVIEEREAGF